LCFTELRLSQVSTHVANFGSLGIGFRRRFLLEKGANPVFYVPNAPAGVANTNATKLLNMAKGDPELEVLASFIKPICRHSYEYLALPALVVGIIIMGVPEFGMRLYLGEFRVE